MKYSLSDLSQKIMQEPRPVLLLDTCVLLDLVRTCSREGADVNTIFAAQSFLNQNSVWMIISEIVQSELLENIETVYTEVEKHLKKLDKNLVQFQNTLSKLPASGTFNYTRKPSEYGLHNELKLLSEQLQQQALVIDLDNECAGRAMGRVVQNIAPSALGKDESKDCTIYEHYLELCRQLRVASFSKDIVFSSSNKSDFGEPNKLRQPIDTELSSLNVKFVNNLSWASSILTTT
ncbi:PIN domain-containing protein [Pseudoalteromonas sp. T1lg24]|uniref:PIN domain-containing protein n=1 Tax=Pseudoalteromonas sp. T1lg24 TaxID=2077099 RepID=UPI000CF6D07F|nr:PIN domain-containing protein [Pseudoalteromonas sp. T1lg24]